MPAMVSATSASAAGFSVISAMLMTLNPDFPRTL
jgi:hypothetical protein